MQDNYIKYNKYTIEKLKERIEILRGRIEDNLFDIKEANEDMAYYKQFEMDEGQMFLWIKELDEKRMQGDWDVVPEGRTQSFFYKTEVEKLDNRTAKERIARKDPPVNDRQANIIEVMASSDARQEVNGRAIELKNRKFDMSHKLHMACSAYEVKNRKIMLKKNGLWIAIS
jgi:hypothetical protein